MACQAGDTADLVAALQAQPQSLDFFEAMRRIECAWPDLPRLGKAARPVDEPVRLGQIPALQFPPSMIAQIARTPAGRLRVLGYFLGLFGPQGPLPLHLTEYAHDRITNARDHTFAAFADIFHHRMLQLFYRSWADCRPTVQFDRPEQDRFAIYVGALVGIAQSGLRNRDALPDRAKLYFSGLLASETRTRAGLESVLREYFGLPISVKECIGCWMPLCSADHLRLGVNPSSATLARSATVGERIWNTQQRIRVRVGPVAVGDLLQLLPGSPSLERLHAVMRNFVGFEYAWDLQIQVLRERLLGTRLARFGHLGWTSWVAPPAQGPDPDDVLIDMSDREE